jgi:hypothetical protein
VKYLGQALVLYFLALAAPAFADSTVTYTYDALGRLVRTVSSGTSTADVSYTLDPAGNRTNVTVTGVGSALPSFSINSVSVGEGAGTATLTVTKSGTASGNLDVNFASANGSALAGSDYTATSGTLTFLAADTSKTIQVNTIDDAVVESAETFTVVLSGNSAGSTISQGTGTVTITDNDVAPPSFAIGNDSASEGNTLVFTVTKSGSGAASVSYATANGTAVSGSDYNSASGTLDFLAADTSKTISVTTVEDTTAESVESMVVNLSNATGGATISDSQGAGTINDEDGGGGGGGGVEFTVNNVGVAEGGVLSFKVEKHGNTQNTYTIDYATANGTATAGSDYNATSGTLTFGPSDDELTVSVQTINDALDESPPGAETVLLNLSNASGDATIRDSQGSGNINDND